MNLQPSEAEAGFDIRVPPTADTESLEKRIAEEWAPASRNMTFRVINLLSVLCLKFIFCLKYMQEMDNFFVCLFKMQT